MRSRPCYEKDGPLPRGLVRIRPRLIGGIDLLVRTHADDLYEPPRRDGLHSVFSLPSVRRPQGWAKTEEVLSRLETEDLRRGEVAQLVDHDHDQEGVDEQRN